MRLEVRPVNYDNDGQELMAVLDRNLPLISHVRRFEWLYRNQPVDTSRSWFLINHSTGAVIGTASVFPRVLWVGGQFLQCGQVGDFAVDASYRTLGPALMLQRATLQPVLRGELSVCYDCPPHLLGMSTFQRLGLSENCQMRRYSLLTRTDRQFRRILGHGISSRALSAVGNFLLCVSYRSRRRFPGVEIAIHSGRFGMEFTDLDHRLNRNGVIRGRRSAEDLNWRFHDDPLNHYTTITARQNGELEGFLIFASDDQDVRIVDLCAPNGISIHLIEAVLDCVRGTAVQTLTIVISENHPVSTVLRELGFKVRAGQTRIVACGQDAALQCALQQQENWALTHADILA